MPDTLQHLRDTIQSGVTFNASIARNLDRLAQYADTMGFPSMARELASDGRACRRRAELLGEVLATSQPKIEEVDS